MDLFEAIRHRRSVRRFTSQAVPKELLEQLIDAGRVAPTARNEQPWEFVVVTDPQMRKTIAQTTDYGPFIADAPACIVVLCKQTKYYLEDGCAATENILLAATGLGLGACWVAGDKKPYAGKIASMLGAPGNMKLVSLIAVGYPADAGGPTPKRPLQDVLHWERF